MPFSDLVGSTTSEQEYTEWVTDELATPDITNAVVDGADAPAGIAITGKRVGNHHQISQKTVKVSYRADASNVIGRTRVLGEQLSRRQQELRRDVEAIALTNQASVADDGNTTAGKMGGLPSWIATAHNNGTAGGFNTSTGLTVARTVGATHALSEATVRDICQTIYLNGGDPTIFMTGAPVIRKFSEYLFTSSARVATLMSDVGQAAEAATAQGSINVFVTDFGVVLKLIPNRLLKTHVDSVSTQVYDAFIFDPAYLALTYLKGYRTDELAKTGLAENRQMSVDWSLKVYNEKSCGLLGDVSPTLAATA